MRYRFGRRAVDFLICRECAVYVAAMIEDEGQAYATLNVVGTDLPGFADREPERLDYHDETDEQRLARRKAKWTPTVLVEAVPNAWRKKLNVDRHPDARPVAHHGGGDPRQVARQGRRHASRPAT